MANSLRPEELTWTGLLGQWVQFAQASVCIPDDADGPRWRASVPAVINLQAVTFALADLPRLPHDEQMLGCDKAEILVTENANRLLEIWGEREMSASLHEIVRDARLALEVATRRVQSPSEEEPSE